MHIALHGRHDDLALAFGPSFFFRLNKREEMGDGFLHHARGLHHLRQEHAAGSEQIAHDIHAVHQRPFNNLNWPTARRLYRKPRFFGVIDDMRIDTFDQGMLQPFGHRPAAPFSLRLFLCHVGPAIFLGKRNQALGRIRIAIENDIFASNAQFRINIIINIKLPRVNDGHIKPCRNSVIEKDGMHRPADGFVTTKAERQVGKSARIMRMRAEDAEFLYRLDKVDAVIIMLLNPRCHRKDVGIEDNILRRKTDTGQQVISPFANLDLAGLRVGLAGFIERHDHNRSTIRHAQARMMQERLFAFFHGYRIDDGLTRNAFQPGLNHAPFGTVDH